jgi:pyrimidine-nucleoside phosphorylase
MQLRMKYLSLIESKREGKILTLEQIQEFIHEFSVGKIPDYQMTTLLMAICFQVRRFSPRF